MAKGDREYLRAYAGRSAGNDQPPRQDDETVEQYAARIGADPDAPTEPTPAATSSSGEPHGEKPNDKTPKAPEGKGKKGGSDPIGDLADRIGRPVKGSGQSLVERVAAVPTPGGIGALLVIILLFVAVVIPVAGGYTRLQLFWLTLLGRTSLPDASGNVPQTGVSASAAASGTSSSSGTAATGGVSRAAVALPAPALPAVPFPMPMPGSTRVSMPGAGR